MLAALACARPGILQCFLQVAAGRCAVREAGRRAWRQQTRDQHRPSQRGAVDVQRAQQRQRDRALVREPLDEGEGEPQAQHCARAGQDRLSVSSCRTMRPRLAPSAPRIANSLPRGEARASSRLERLTQAMSRIAPTADHKHHQRTPQLAADVILQRDRNHRVLVVLAAAVRMLVVPAHVLRRLPWRHLRAWPSVTPGFMRPIMVMMLPQSRGGP